MPTVSAQGIILETFPTVRSARALISHRVLSIASKATRSLISVWTLQTKESTFVPYAI